MSGALIHEMKCPSAKKVFNNSVKYSVVVSQSVEVISCNQVKFTLKQRLIHRLGNTNTLHVEHSNLLINLTNEFITTRVLPPNKGLLVKLFQAGIQLGQSNRNAKTLPIKPSL